METEFKKLKLNEDDILVIKVNVEGLSDVEMKTRVHETREDEFVKNIENKWNKVFVTYSGIDLQILRLNESEKLIVLVDLTPFKTRNEEEEYLDFLNFKLSAHLDAEKFILIPTKNNVKLSVNQDKGVLWMLNY